MTTVPTVDAAREIEFLPRLGDPAQLLRLLSAEGALRDGHFRLLSGQHTNTFLAFSALAADPANLDEINSWLGPTVDAWVPDAVLAPSTAGVGLAATLARRISAPLHLATVGADGRPEDVLGSVLPAAARVLAVNDVSTTGTAIDALARIARSHGAHVVGAVWFASRGLANVDDDLGFPTAHVVDVNLEALPQGDCPQCAAGLDTAEDALDLN